MPRFAMPFARPTETLSVAEQRDLIAAAQDVPVITSTDPETGKEHTRLGKTPASEAAMERLVACFLPVIEKEARLAKVLDEDDALATVFEEFVATVHRHDLTSTVPFSATIGTILRRKVSDTDRTSDVVQIKEFVAAAYWRLMHKHEGDVVAAYDEVKTTANGLAPATFLAVHNIIGGVDSIDPLVSAEDSESGTRHALASAVGSPEERVVLVAEVEWLLKKISARQESIVRLAYGFDDPATETVSVAKGFRPGDLLDNGQIAYALDMARSTVSRDHRSALSVMHEALIDSLADALR